MSACGTILNRQWLAPIHLHGGEQRYSCSRFDDDLPDRRFEQLARTHLSARELEIWSRASRLGRRRRQWLCGRFAAKDAVCFLLKNRYAIEALPAEVEIYNDEAGRPFIEGPWIRSLDCRVALSITHWQNGSAAAAGLQTGRHGIGLDVEMRSRNLGDVDVIAFSGEEKRILGACAGEAKNERLLKFWCAKEALGKALGSGMAWDPRNLIVRYISRKNDVLKLSLERDLAKRFPEYAGRLLSTFVGSDEDLVYAFCQA